MDFQQEVKFQSRRSLENELGHRFQSSMDQLHSLWIEFGIDKRQIMVRSNTVLMHIQNLLDDLVKEEEELMIDIKSRIKKYEEDLYILYFELGEESNEPYANMPLLEQDKYLYSRVECLKNKKMDRIENYKRLQKNESRLCNELGTAQRSKSLLSEVPKLQDLQDLENYVFELTDLRENRYHKYCQAKHQLTTILEETHITPEVPFVKEVISHDNEKLLLSQENLDQMTEVLEKVQKLKNEMVDEIQILKKKLSDLWDFIDIDSNVKNEFHKQHSEIRRSTVNAIKQEIKRCEDLREQAIIQRISKLREELLMLWDKCYISDVERHRFDPFYLEDYTEELLKLHEMEVDRWKNYRENTEAIFDKINQRHELWNKMLEFERKAQNPNRFMNRGGKLLQEERERNKLLKDLPRLEEEILRDIEKYEETNTSPILINGMNFTEYIKQQWENHQKEKENERLVRQKERAASCTPNKRYAISTPLSAPSKLFRTNAAITNPLNKQGVTPNNKLVSAKKCKTSVKRVAVRSMRTRSAKRNLLTQKNFDEGTKSPPRDVTLYANFEKELNRTGRDRLRSSTITPKYRVLGSKANRRDNSQRKRLQHISKSISKSKSKSAAPSSESTPGVTKTPTKAVPPRGKLGLPFLI